jgi:hypothetical protein
MGHHVKPVVLPTILLEPTVQPNGAIDASLLVTIKDHNTTRGFDMTFNAVAARAWVAMSRAARAAGHDLYPTDKGYGTYRNLQMQTTGFKWHYTTDRLEGRPTKVWDGKTWFLKPDFEPAARPGESNHGLGVAIDVAFLEAVPRSSDKRSIWVLDNYERFGFSHEFEDKSVDPRHIRYYKGDKIPDAVLDVPEVVDEGGSDETQIPEDDMLPIITNQEATRGAPAHVIKFVLMDDGRLRVLGEEEWRVRGSLEGTPWSNELINKAGVIG